MFTNFLCIQFRTSVGRVRIPCALAFLGNTHCFFTWNLQSESLCVYYTIYSITTGLYCFFFFFSLHYDHNCFFVLPGRTFPGHPYFSPQLGPGQLALFNLLKAYSLLDKEVGYCQGLSFVAGVLLMHVSTFGFMSYYLWLSHVQVCPCGSMLKHLRKTQVICCPWWSVYHWALCCQPFNGNVFSL